MVDGNECTAVVVRNHFCAMALLLVDTVKEKLETLHVEIKLDRDRPSRRVQPTTSAWTTTCLPTSQVGCYKH